MNRLFFIVALIVVGNAGCTDFVKNMAIENADWLAMYELDKYFDLTSEQEDIIKPYVVKEIKAIQSDLVPLLIKELEEVSSTVEKLSPEELEKFFITRPKKYWLDFILPKIPLIADFFTLLTPKQLEHFEGVYTKKFSERWELANVSPEDYADEYRDLQEERLEKLEKWYGPFDKKQQKAIFSKTWQTLSEYKEDTLRYKERREFFIKRTLEIESKAERVTFLSNWIELRSSNLNQKSVKQTRQRLTTLDFLVFIEQLLTQKQRIKRQERIKAVIADLKYFQTIKY